MGSWVTIAAAASALLTYFLSRPSQSLKDDLADQVPELVANEQKREDERDQASSQSPGAKP